MCNLREFLLKWSDYTAKLEISVYSSVLKWFIQFLILHCVHMWENGLLPSQLSQLCPQIQQALQHETFSEQIQTSKLSSCVPHANIHTPRGTTSFPEDIQAHNAPLMWSPPHQRKSSVVDDSAEIYFEWGRRNGNKCVARVQASIFRLHTAVNP